MKFELHRLECRPDGILGVLLDEQGNEVAKTLEHAYQDGDVWRAKIPADTYTLTRSEHSLAHSMPFATFEFPEFTGWDGLQHSKPDGRCLIHSGNTEQDSEGCILLGTKYGILGTADAVLNSKVAFSRFMGIAVCHSIELTITEA